jgi:hypothetical protein
MNLQVDDMVSIKVNTDILIDASKEVFIELNVEKKYVLLSRHQNAVKIIS